MSRKLTVLDRIDIASPCSADWNEMRGNDFVRFCDNCQLSVNNISALTHKEAMKLVLKSKGRLCVQYVRKPDGKIQNASRQFHQITRRASRITAGIFTAALSLSSVSSAQPSHISSTKYQQGITISEFFKEKKNGETTSLAGKVTGRFSEYTQNESSETNITYKEKAIAGAVVKLINQKTNERFLTTTDEDGVYRFDNLEVGTYRLKIEANGFEQFVVNDLNLSVGNKESRDVKLENAIYLRGEIAIFYENKLVEAIAQDNIEQVEKLILSGSDVNAKDKNWGLTSLQMATSRNNLEIVKLLLNAGANPNLRDESGQTALMMTNENSSIELIQDLLKAGADVNAQDDEGETALMTAAQSANLVIMQELLNAGANVNAQTDNGQTALMMIVERASDKSVDAVHLLVSAGANVNARNKDGKTALSVAIAEKLPKVVEILKSYGAIAL